MKVGFQHNKKSIPYSSVAAVSCVFFCYCIADGMLLSVGKLPLQLSTTAASASQ